MTVDVRPLAERDLPEADRIFRLAFGTFMGMDDPTTFAGDSDWTRTRWRSDPDGAFGAYDGDTLVGSNFATRWGSFGFFGPLTVRPDLWNGGVAKRLLDATMARFEEWGVRQAALFTFAQSTKHVGLYQKYGFWPQQLTIVLSKRVERDTAMPGGSFFSRVPAPDRPALLARSAALTDAVLPGMDVRREIESVDRQRIGDTVLLSAGGELTGLAICHVGKGSEAGSGTTYLKFAAVRPGAEAPGNFAKLLDACEGLAAVRQARVVVGGVNTARGPAYRAMLERGYRPVIQGVAMQRPDQPGTNRPDRFVIDDWR
jgi:GNAT superfamily N-acetyltransferase